MIVGVGMLRGRGRYAASRTIVAPGALIGSATFTRSQAAGVESTSLGTDDATWGAFAADVPRFYGANRPLLIEGQRTNVVSNPRTPGGTGWTSTNIASVTPTTGPDGVVDSASTINEGTATGNHIIAATIPSVYTTRHTWAVYLRPGTCDRARVLFGGVGFGSGVAVSVLLSGAGSFLGSPGAGVLRSSITKTGDWYRVEVSGNSLASGSTQAQVRMIVAGGTTDNYTGTNRTLDVAWPQVEVAAFASSVVLPPVDTPGASTRNADIVSHTLAGLGLQANGAGTILLRGTLPQSAPTGVNQMLFQVDDGTDDNRYVVRNGGGGNNIDLLNVVGGVAGSALRLGTMTPGTAFSVGVVCDGNGRVAGAFNASAAQVITSGPSSGLTRLLEGSSGTAGGSEAMFGTVSRLAVLPRIVSDAELQSLVSGFR